VTPGTVFAALPPGASITTAKTIAIDNAGDEPLTFRGALMPALGGSQPTAGAAPSIGAGGPDAFGYFFRDSDHLGGPVFDWTDIAATGSPVPLTGNNVTSAPIPIGFSFPFYGGSFSTVRVCTNGWLSFTSTRILPQNPDVL